ncbi:CDP-diacylglycerol--glycerol-3-phosphate 3-phosphatidyltransferase [Gammaproteobacteria bacterium]|nr:CDP-diacylglycerol--glycerol-3-phosphate 3-phosphatidyltransferase [Gammaproteobacteria bacterium]
MKHLIFFLTFLRVILSPIIFLLIVIFNFYGVSLILFIFAAASDFLDGYLARKYNLVSELGGVLDPIADKILIVFVLFGISLVLGSSYVGFVGSIILAREFWVGALRDLNARNNNLSATKVSFLAKLKTSIQFLAFSGFLIGLYLENELIIFISNFVLFLALIITLQTGLSYTMASFKR